MSKAFTSGDAEEAPLPPAKAPVLPPGTPNYVTPAGAKRLEAEREQRIAEKATLADTVENQPRKAALEDRLVFLTERLNAAKVMDPAAQPKDRVAFGAMVTVRNSSGETRTWRIVGVDETDLNQGWISWISPLARALMDKKVGETAELGEQRFKVQTISYA